MTGACGDRRGSVQGAVGEKGTLPRPGVAAGAGQRGDSGDEGQAPGDSSAVWNAGLAGARRETGLESACWGKQQGPRGKPLQETTWRALFFTPGVIGNNRGRISVRARSDCTPITVTGRAVEILELLTQLQE